MLRLALLLFLLPLLTPGGAVEQKCGACGAMASELEVALQNERPKNDLDLRHRLDSRGQREGRVIDYRTSELRVVELLDDLCSKMKEYTLDRSTGEWSKLNKSIQRSEHEKQEDEAHSKAIASYCGRLLEKHEDELAALIRKGEVVPGSVHSFLCQRLAKDCSRSSEDGDL